MSQTEPKIWWERPEHPALPAAPVAEWSEQQLLDHVATWMLAQAERSQVPSPEYGVPPRCVYRQGELACAVGCLVPDELARTLDEGKVGSVSNIATYAEYRPAAETREWLGLRQQGEVGRQNWPLRTRLLLDLQKTHDSCSLGDWPRRLAKIARDYELSLPPALAHVLLADQRGETP